MVRRVRYRSRAAAVAAGWRYKAIGKPEDMFDDPHLNAGGDLPGIGAHTREVLRDLGVGDDEFETLAAGKTIQ